MSEVYLMKPILILLFSLFSCFIGKTQSPLHFEKLTTENGLSHNKVNCILQDKRGFIWIGTNDGLNRYDGKSFIHFFKKPSDTTTIAGNIITDLLEDREGIIWITTADGGLCRYNYRLPASKQFRGYRNLSGKPVVTITNSLIEDRFGHLWVGTSGYSVLRFNKKKEQFEEPVLEGTKTILDLSVDGKGFIWAGRQGGGLLKVNPSNLAYEQDERYRNLYAKLPHASITALLQDKQKNMWYGSWDKVLYRFNWATQQEEIFQTTASPYSFNNDQVNAFAEDKWGRIWMGGDAKGLQIFDPRWGRFYQYAHNAAIEGSLADNHINCIFIDDADMVWIGTNRGISVYNSTKQQFSQTFFPARNSEAPIVVYDFFEESENNIWVGTSNGLYSYHPADGSLAHKPLSYNGKALQVTKFFKDVDGSVYLGTNISLFLYQPLTGKLSLLPNTDKDKVMNQIIESRVVSIVRDTIQDHPVLLVSPYGHYLAYYDLVEKKWVSRLDSTQNILERYNLQDNLVRKLFKGSNGALWLATAKRGLGLWQKDKAVNYWMNEPGKTSSLSNNNIFDIVEDRKSNLWISTYGGGLHYFDAHKKTFTQIPSSNNLLEGLQTDLYGNVWMISNGRLNRFDPRKQIYVSYNLPDLQKSGGVKGSVFKDSKGFMYVAGTDYFVRYHPGNIKDLHEEPKVCLTDFFIFDRPNSHLLYQNNIQLSHQQNYFTIGFSAPHFSGGNDVTYSYQLQGFDKDWVDAGSRNFVSYSNLDGGSYHFKVRASLGPGMWTKEYVTLNITVIPPFWKRPIFFLICVIATIAIIWGMYRYRINEILKRQAIRNKIAQDLHDNVGSTLSSISVYSQVAKIYHGQEKKEDLQQTLEKISSASSEMISELNDTVWAINPRNDHMDVIIQRMESFTRPLLALQGIKFSFEYDYSVLSLNLPMEKRKNFYLIYKEAVNNVLKYSGCSKLSVSIRQKGFQVILKIEDDGKGFNIKQTAQGYSASDIVGGGNGLKNMQLRAKEMNAQLRLWSEPNKSTGLELIFYLTSFGDMGFGKKGKPL